MNFIKQLFEKKAKSEVISDTRIAPVKISIGEFAGKLAAIATDYFSVGLSIGSQSLQKHDEQRILFDAFVLNWYATQNFMAIRCTQQNLNDDEQVRMAKEFNEAWFGLLDIQHETDRKSFKDILLNFGLTDEIYVTDRKLMIMNKAREQRPQYDKILLTDQAQDFLGFDFLFAIGQAFVRISGSENSFPPDRIRDLGGMIYKKALKRCLSEFSNSYIDTKL